MSLTLLSLDPGTHKAGVALWSGTKLADCQLLTMKDRRVEHRIIDVLEKLQSLVNRLERPILAMEKPFLNREFPAYELWVLVHRVISEARWSGWELHQYAAATVVATNRLQEDRGRGKEVIHRHIKARYGSTIPIEKLDPNVVDAIGIGYTHLVKTRQL